MHYAKSFIIGTFKRTDIILSAPDMPWRNGELHDFQAEREDLIIIRPHFRQFVTPVQTTTSCADAIVSFSPRRDFPEAFRGLEYTS